MWIRSSDLLSNHRFQTASVDAIAVQRQWTLAAEDWGRYWYSVVSGLRASHQHDEVRQVYVETMISKLPVERYVPWSYWLVPVASFLLHGCLRAVLPLYECVWTIVINIRLLTVWHVKNMIYSISASVRLWLSASRLTFACTSFSVAALRSLSFRTTRPSIWTLSSKCLLTLNFALYLHSIRSIF